MVPPAEPTYLSIVSIPHPCKDIEPTDHDSQLEQLQKTHKMVQWVTDMHNKHQPCTRGPWEFKEHMYSKKPEHQMQWAFDLATNM